MTCFGRREMGRARFGMMTRYQTVRRDGPAGRVPAGAAGGPDAGENGQKCPGAVSAADKAGASSGALWAVPAAARRAASSALLAAAAFRLFRASLASSSSRCSVWESSFSTCALSALARSAISCSTRPAVGGGFGLGGAAGGEGEEGGARRARAARASWGQRTPARHSSESWNLTDLPSRHGTIVP